MTRITFCTLCLCTALFFPAVLYAQGVSKPEMTSIPGGFFAKWASPVDIAAMQLDKSLTGSFEVMFDVPSVEFVANVIDVPPSAPNNHEIITVLADYWIVRGKPERAIPLYENSLKQGNLDDERMLVFQNNLAMLYSQALKQHDKALSVVDEALKANKDNVILLDTKGLILLNSGQPAEAAPVLNLAVDLSCQLPIYCMHLAYALQQDGRISQARRYLDPVRDQLISTVPKMGKENKAMFDSLMVTVPPIDSP